MAGSVGYFSHNLCYTTEVSRSPCIFVCLSSTVGETMNTKPDNREDAKDYDKFAIGVYKGDLLVDHVPIETSSLCCHFLNNNEQNILTAIVTEERNREVGLVVPAKLFFQTQKTENLVKHWKLSLQRENTYCQLWNIPNSRFL